MSLPLAVFAASPVKPLDRAQVLAFMDFGQDSFRASQLIARDGLSFAPTPGDLKMFISFGAKPALTAAISQAKHPTATAADADEQAALAHLTSCLVFANKGNADAAAQECDVAARYEAVAAYFVEGGVWLQMGKIDQNTAQEKMAAGARSDAAAAFGQSVDAFKRAAAALKLAEKAESGNPDVINALGLSLWHEGKMNSAKNAFETAMRIDPNFAAPHNNLASIYLQQNDLNGAKSELLDAIRINPSQAGWHRNLAFILARQRDLTGAAAELRKALALDPANAADYGLLANVLAAAKDYDGAIAAYRFALNLAPHWAAGHAELARLLLIERHPSEARSECQEAAQGGNASITASCETIDQESARMQNSAEFSGSAPSASNTLPMSTLGNIPPISLGESGELINQLKTLQFADFPALYKKAVNGDAKSQAMVCIAYRRGWFVKADQATGFAWCLKAAKQNDVAGEEDVGVQDVEGLGVQQDGATGVQWLERAAAAGSLLAMNDLGAIYANGASVPRDFAAAMKWYKKGADGGDPHSVTDLAIMYLMGQGVRQNEPKAMKLLRKASDAGYSYADVIISLIYQQGYGVPRDPQESMKWLQKAAALDSPQAERELGWIYANGIGTPRDYAQAAKWYRAAAEQGDAAASYGLGVRYMNGQGVPRDPSEAAKWLRLAADQGHGDAAYNLGLIYTGWLGQSLKNTPLAVKYLTIAANQGIGDGQCVLANLYASGDGTPKNLIAAYQWALLASNHGAEQCAKTAETLASQMKPADIEQAKARASAWKPQPHPMFNY